MSYSRWSKAKKKLDGFICDSLKDRVQYHVTNYRKAHDQLGRAFITVDKVEVWNMCSIKSETAVYRKDDEIRRRLSVEYDCENQEQNHRVDTLAYEETEAEGIFSQFAFMDYVREFCNLPIEGSLHSDNILIKIIALMDRRVGKRTLEQMKESIQYEKEIVQYFLKLRWKQKISLCKERVFFG